MQAPCIGLNAVIGGQAEVYKNPSPHCKNKGKIRNKPIVL